jgi:uncharacterized membrane protein YphA (DoxX/SURF4 family)
MARMYFQNTGKGAPKIESGVPDKPGQSLMRPMRYQSTILMWIRVVLGVAFIAYGVVKIAGGQFLFGKSWIIDSQATDGPTLVWSFFGWSPVYGRFIGLGELMSGVLLIIPRTRTLGAVCLFPITANITVMDFCFDYPAVKYVSLFFTFLCVVLLVADYRKLRILFWCDRELDNLAVRELVQLPDTDAPPHPPEPPRWRLVVAAVSVGIPVALLLTNLVATAIADPVQPAYRLCVEQGWKESDLELLRWRETGWSGIGRDGYVEIRGKDGVSPAVIRVDVHLANGFAGWRAVGYHEARGKP